MTQLAGPVRWLALAWCGLIVVQYVRTVERVIAHPITPGDDGTLAIVWLSIGLAVVVSMAMWPRWHTGAAWLGLTVLVSMGVIGLSGQLPAALTVAWMLAAAWASGDFVIRAVLKSDLASPVVAIALGLGLVANGAMALGAMAILNTTSIAILLAVMVLPGVLRWRHLAVAATANARALRAWLDAPVHAVVLGLAGAAFLFSVIWGVVPELQFDALNYHLMVGRHYLDAGRIVDLPYFFHSYFAHLGDMLFMVGLAVDGPVAAKLLSVAWGVLAACGVYVVGRMVAGPRVGAWAAGLYYLTPLVIWESTTANVDGAVAYLIIAAIVPLIRWLEHPGTRADLVVAAAVFGVAVGTKLGALWAAPAMAGVALAAAWRRMPAVTFLRTTAAAVAVFVVLAGPTYVRVYALTGNPVYPLFKTVFSSDHPIPKDVGNTELLGSGRADRVSWGNRLRLPYYVTFETSAFGTSPDGNLGAGLLLALPTGLLLFARTRATALVVALVASVLIFWSGSYPYSRFLVPVMPAVAVLGAMAMDAIGRTRLQQALGAVMLGALLLAQGAATPPQFWTLPERVPWRAATGQETPDSLLRRTVRGHDAILALNAAAQPGERVLGSGMEHARYYIEPDMVAVGMSWNMPWLAARIPPDAMAQRLRDAGVRFVMVDHQSAAYRKGLTAFSDEFRDAWTDVIFDADGVTVRRVRDSAHPR